MKNNKIYMPVDAIERHQDFDMYYEDGSTFLSFKGPWEKETDKVTIFGRMGGEMGSIRPNPEAVTFFIRVERYEYELHTYRIFKEYFLKGMLWHIDGSLQELPLDFVKEGKTKDEWKKEVHIRTTTLPGKGECYEIKVSDLSHLRVAAASVAALAIKEHYRGLSEGYDDFSTSFIDKMKRRFSPKGYSIEELEVLEEKKRVRDAIMADLEREANSKES